MNKDNISKFKQTAVVLVSVAAVWLLFDRLTKIYFDSGQFSIGQKITDSFFGIFHFTLVHNTGAAFGIFGDFTFMLGIIAIVVSVLFFVIPFIYLVKFKDKKPKYNLTFFHNFAIAIICAGGLGNAYDRLITKYVIDFIDFDFIDFPVFNIADIGVTCGIVILIAAMLYNIYKERKRN